MARIHRRTIQKDLHDPDNHAGVITHLEPDTLEHKVKWALGSITTNKASGGDGIPVELFLFYLFLFIIIIFYSILIKKNYTCVPHPEPSSLLPPHTIPLGRPSAPAPKTSIFK